MPFIHLSKTEFESFLIDTIHKVFNFLPSQILVAFLLSMFKKPISNGNSPQHNLRNTIITLIILFASKEIFNLYFPTRKKQTPK